MKKLLIGTTALVGAALIASAASAESPKVTVGGFMDWQAGVGLNDDRNSSQRHYGFRNDTEITFKIDGMADSGLKYGGEIALEADVDSEPGLDGYSDADNQGLNASRTYLYLEGSFGRFEAGSTIGPDQTLKIDASSIARATGGVDGAFTYFNNGGNGVVGTFGYVVTPDLPMNYGPPNVANGGQGYEMSENANKIIYYTPRWMGLQGGISWAPDQFDRGQLMQRFNTAGTTQPSAVPHAIRQYEDIIQAGINYDNTFNGWGVGLAATGEWGDAINPVDDELDAWQLGGKLSFMGFTVAASWAEADGAFATAASNTDINFWTVGGAYEWGPFGVSVTYLDSEIDPAGTSSHEFEHVSVGMDWKMAPGFTPYLEVGWFEYDVSPQATPSTDSEGNVVIIGSQLAF